MDFDKGLTDKIPNNKLNQYKNKSFLTDVDLNYCNFDVFLEQREKPLITKSCE